MTFNEKCKLVQIHTIINNTAFGDLDPTCDLTDDEVRREYPIIWAAKHIAEMIGDGPWDIYTPKKKWITDLVTNNKKNKQ